MNYCPLKLLAILHIFLATGGCFYSNTWAVKFSQPDISEIERILKESNFRILNQITKDRLFHVICDNVSRAEKYENKEKTNELLKNEMVEWASQQYVNHRYRRFQPPNDPLFKRMWYMLNTGQSSGPAGVDIDVLPVWSQGITGKGIIISVLDDGKFHSIVKVLIIPILI
ncbi:PC3-like endoprotease variant A [Thelohanellus kitauei]|uniref:PC3-like endoprotease variant A n=1 Tax=Thelohanellus kitauei TaxID=669202 RepID=A0A0C2IIB2_THEKT|nr:PC3-like endoprotease variant A [Thelohanellus kitauei]